MQLDVCLKIWQHHYSLSHFGAVLALLIGCGEHFCET